MAKAPGIAALALQTYYAETNPTGKTFGDEGSEEFGQAVTDLLADLMHLCERAGTEFDAFLVDARRHYAEEREG